MLFTEYNYAEDIAVQREEARKQGLTQGFLKALFSLVREKLLTLEVAAAKANMSQEEFSRLLAQSN